jgi:hypothetical protein
LPGDVVHLCHARAQGIELRCSWLALCRQAGGQTFKHSADFNRRENLVRTEAPNPEPARGRNFLKQALLMEAHHGHARRGSRDAQKLDHVGFRETLAGGKLTAEDQVPQPLNRFDRLISGPLGRGAVEERARQVLLLAQEMGHFRPNIADSARRDEDRVQNQVIPGIPSLAALDKISQG